MFAMVQVLPMEYRNCPNMNTVHKIKRSRRDGMINDIKVNKCSGGTFVRSGKLPSNLLRTQ